MRLRSIKLCSGLVIILMFGCASEPERASFNDPLYNGKPVDTLSSEAPPLNEKEAIMRGDTALQSNNTDLALYEYLRSLEFPEAKYQDKTLYNIGRIHQTKGNYSLAEQAYLLAVKANPNNEQVLEQLGSIYLKSGKVDQAKSYFYRAINADQIRLKSGKSIDIQSSSIVAKVADLSVDTASPSEAYMGIGILYDVDGKHGLAQSFYAKALDITPNSVNALINTGYSYYMSGNYQQAQRFMVSALEEDANNEKAQNNLALIYLAKGQVKRAINVFTKQVGAAEALNNVGYFLILQGKPEEAIPYLQQAIDKNPSYYKVANENLERALSEVRSQATP